LAHVTLRRVRPKVLVVAGSVGKSTTASAIASVMRRGFHVGQGPVHFNTTSGAPLSVLGIPGNMKILTDIVTPDYAVMTTIAVEHTEHLEDLDTITKEEGGLIDALPEGGIAFLDADDPRVMSMRGRTTAKVRTFGLVEGADVLARRTRLEREMDECFNRVGLHHDGATTNVVVRPPAPGLVMDSRRADSIVDVVWIDPRSIPSSAMFCAIAGEMPEMMVLHPISTAAFAILASLWAVRNPGTATLTRDLESPRSSEKSAVDRLPGNRRELPRT